VTSKAGHHHAIVVFSMTADRGFVVVPGVLADAEIEALRSDLASMPRGRAGVRHVLGHPAIRALSEDPRLVQLATRLLGAPPQAFKATLFDKSPASNWLVAWHQDLALPVRSRVDAPGWGPWTDKGGRLHAIAPAEALSRVVALRVHLDDCGPDNGPLRVVPGSHRFGRLSTARINELVGDVAPIECTVGAGGIVAMRPLVLHASSKSVSRRPRRVLHVEYATDLVVGPGIELAVA
jgi:ectoine hydroxylase-related dioxygenase (phytanoyl-CoA dioxygenase family)